MFRPIKVYAVRPLRRLQDFESGVVGSGAMPLSPVSLKPLEGDGNKSDAFS